MSIERLGPSSPPPAPAPEVIPAPAPSPDGAPSPFSKLVHGLGKEVNRGEAMMKAALAASRSGRDLGSAELLSLQAGVYRYSEAVDLAAKLVDRASNGVKTVVSGGQ